MFASLYLPRFWEIEGKSGEFGIELAVSRFCLRNWTVKEKIWSKFFLTQRDKFSGYRAKSGLNQLSGANSGYSRFSL